MKKNSYLILTLVAFSAIIGISGPITLAEATVDNSDWHTDDNVTTSDYTVTYDQVADLGGCGETLIQYMTISYLDGTEVSQGIEYRAYFNPGGLDLENDLVLDWGKYNSSAVCIFTSTKETTVTGSTSKQTVGDYMMFKGNSTNLRFPEIYDGEGHFRFVQPISTAQLGNGPVTYISFTNGTCKISSLTVTTSEYTYNENSYNSVKTKFDLNVIGTMSNGSTEEIGTISQSFPAVVSFEFNHNVTETRYKTSVNLDWSSHKAFITNSYEYPLETNDSYFIVEQNHLQVSHTSTSGYKELYQFTATEDNTTAIFTDEGQEICREYLPKTYNITGGNAQEGLLCSYNYYLNGYMKSQTEMGSNIFVVYDGFKYDNSTGLIVDPEVVIPCFLHSLGGDIGYEFTWVIALASIGIAVVIVGFRKQYHYLRIS